MWALEALVSNCDHVPPQEMRQRHISIRTYPAGSHARNTSCPWEPVVGAPLGLASSHQCGVWTVHHVDEWVSSSPLFCWKAPSSLILESRVAGEQIGSASLGCENKASEVSPRFAEVEISSPRGVAP